MPGPPRSPGALGLVQPAQDPEGCDPHNGGIVPPGGQGAGLEERPLRESVGEAGEAGRPRPCRLLSPSPDPDSEKPGFANHAPFQIKSGLPLALNIVVIMKYLDQI